MLQLPGDILSDANPHRKIKMDDFTIVESCLYRDEMAGSAVLEQHELIFILNGILTLKVEGTEITLNKNEVLLLKKGTRFHFSKKSLDKENRYASILFFIKDKFIADFLTHYGVDFSTGGRQTGSFFKPSGNVYLNAYMLSLIPYFNSQLALNKEFLRIKTFELLFNLVETDIALFRNITNPDREPDYELMSIMEENFQKNLTLSEFARLTNRSLSTFKRDFKKIFEVSPRKWITHKRLSLAFQLLKSGYKKPGEVYLELGYEDFSHFSKSFKAKYGSMPSEIYQLNN